MRTLGTALSRGCRLSHVILLLAASAMAAAPVITKQPEPWSTTAYGRIQFQVAVEGCTTPAQLAAYTFQWERLPDKSSTWRSVTNQGDRQYPNRLVIQRADRSYVHCQFRVKVTRNGATSTSDPALLTINYLSFDTSLPADPALAAGQAATFTARATAPDATWLYPRQTPFYQWQSSRNGGGSWENIPGATANTYTTPVLSAADNACLYRALAWGDPYATSTSRAAKVLIDSGTPTPVITQQPSAVQQSVDGTATFSVSATAAPDAVYQWERSSDGIQWASVSSGQGANTPRYTTAPLTPADDGVLFRARISVLGAAPVHSNPAPVVLNNYLRIDREPADQAVLIGQRATFSVAASGKPSPVTYQWQCSMDPYMEESWANVATGTGGTSATYTTDPTAHGDQGLSFRVLVGNGTNQVATSRSASLDAVSPILSGTVGVSGATIHGDSVDHVSGDDGTYRFAVNLGQTLTLSVSHPSCTFTPASITIGPIQGNVVGQNFTPLARKTLDLQIQGLPADLSPLVRVGGPDGFQALCRSTGSVSIPKAGAYTISTSGVWGTGAHAGCIYQASPTQVIQVGEGEHTPATVTYTKGHTLTLPLVNTGLKLNVPLEMVLVPQGSFTMGPDSAGNTRTVTFPRSFWISRTEVTQIQWKAVCGALPNLAEQRDPAQLYTWEEGQAFLGALNTLAPMGYRSFRFPSEAEWEYAARAGSTTTYSFGNDSTLAEHYAWWEPSPGMGTNLVDVDWKEPNAWGLHFMHGNAFEWCQDDWHDTYEGLPLDGSVWSGGGAGLPAVRRGGNTVTPLEGTASACRGQGPRNTLLPYTGFRLVLPADRWENAPMTPYSERPEVAYRGEFHPATGEFSMFRGRHAEYPRASIYNFTWKHLANELVLGDWVMNWGADFPSSNIFEDPQVLRSPLDDRLVLFPGANDDGALFAFNGQQQVWYTQACSRGKRRYAALSTDFGHQGVLLFGGEWEGAVSSETVRMTRQGTSDRGGWNWEVLAPSGAAPSARYHAAMVHDSDRDRFVLFGGVGPAGAGGLQAHGDTWEYDHLTNTWTEVLPGNAPNAPEARENPMMAYDPVNHLTYMAGGRRPSDNHAFRDLWCWNGRVWQLMIAEGDSQVSPGVIWFDTTVNKLMGYSPTTTFYVVR